MTTGHHQISLNCTKTFAESVGIPVKSRRISWNSKKFHGILRDFSVFEEIPWESVDAVQDAMPRDMPSSRFAAFACKTKGIPCLRGRPARPAKRQKCTRRSAFPREITGISWKSPGSLKMCRGSLNSQQNPGNPTGNSWFLREFHQDSTIFHLHGLPDAWPHC